MPEWVVKKARVEWCSAGMVGGMWRVRSIFCGGEEERAGGRRREEREKRIVGRFRGCIVVGWFDVGKWPRDVGSMLVLQGKVTSVARGSIKIPNFSSPTAASSAPQKCYNYNDKL